MYANVETAVAGQEEEVSLICHNHLILNVEELNRGVHIGLWLDLEMSTALANFLLSIHPKKSTSSTQRAAKIRPGSSSSFLKTVLIQDKTSIEWN